MMEPAKARGALSLGVPDAADWRSPESGGRRGRNTGPETGKVKVDGALIAELDRMTKKIHLGPALRVSAIHEFAVELIEKHGEVFDLGTKSVRSGKAFCAHVEQLTGCAPDFGAAVLERLVRLTSAVHVREFDACRTVLQYCLTQYLNELRVRLGSTRADSLSVAAVWDNRAFHGPHGLDEFRLFIRLADRPRQIFDVPGKFVVEANPDRQRMLDDIFAFLRPPAPPVQAEARARQPDRLMAGLTDDAARASRMVLNITGPGMWRGLSALGSHIARELDRTAYDEGDERRCLFLPLGMWAQPADGSLETKSPAEGGFLDVLAILRHFYCDRYETIEHRDSIGTHDDLGAVMHEIRAGMRKRARILIVDGVYFPEDPTDLDILERFSAGNTILGVLSRILDVPLAAISGVEDLETFLNNRIVILSNTQLTEAGSQAGPRGWSLPYNLKGPSVLPLVPPRNNDGDKIIGMHDLDNSSIVIEFRSSTKELHHAFCDVDYFAIDAFFGLYKSKPEPARREAFTALLDAIVSKGNHRAQSISVTDAIFNRLIGSCGEKERFLLKMVFIISLAPDGVRRSTLKRIVKASLQIKPNAAPVTFDDISNFKRTKLSDDRVDSSIDEAINAMLDMFPSMLVEKLGDFIPGYDTAPFGLEMAQSEAAWRDARSMTYDAGDAQSHVAIAFTFPEFRVRLRELLALRYGIGPYQAGCRLLALDALRQQAAAFRHVGIPDGQLMRPWRRHVALILFALQSLPVKANSENQVEITDEYDDLTNYTPSQYKTSYKLYKYIYFFAYRRQMERPPAYNISRLYGMTSFKDRILRAFDQPWRLWPKPLSDKARSEDWPSLLHSVISGSSAQGDTVSDRTGNGSGRSASILNAHDTALVTTNLALGRVGAARTSLNRMRGQGRIAEPSTILSVLKRDLDIAILNIDELAGVYERCAESHSKLGGTPSNRISREHSKALVRLLLGSEATVRLDRLLNAVSQQFVRFLLEGSDVEPQWQDVDAGCAEPDRPCDIDREVKAIVGQVEGVFAGALLSPSGIASFADVLFRIAEHVAVSADASDIGYRVEETGLISAADVLTRMRRLGVFESVCPEDRKSWVAQFSKSLAIFRIAEAFRLFAFETGPNTDTFFASGHAIRQMVRVSLKLENFRRKLHGDSGGEITDGLFVRQARYGATTLSSHLFRYPRERAAMLILEASAIRLLTRSPIVNPYLLSWESTIEDLRARAKSLSISRAYLEVAEPLLKVLGHKSRWRLRLSLERAKVHRGLAESNYNLSKAYMEREDHKSSIEVAEKASLFLRLYSLDVKNLVSVAEFIHDYSLWRGIASHQAARLSQLRDRWCS